MEDRFLCRANALHRLVEDFKKYPYIYIAFDFDNTIYDYNERGDTYPEMIYLLKYLSGIDRFKLILHTARTGDNLTFAIDHCNELHIEVDYVNESPLINTLKPAANLYLDDRAGLNEAYNILRETLNYLNYDYKYQPAVTD